jgi:hypothetical protein
MREIEAVMGTVKVTVLETFLSSLRAHMIQMRSVLSVCGQCLVCVIGD